LLNPVWDVVNQLYRNPPYSCSSAGDGHTAQGQFLGVVAGNEVTWRRLPQRGFFMHTA